MTIKQRFRKALINYSIDFITPEDFLNKFVTLRVSFIQNNRMKAYTMKFRKPRSKWGRLVLNTRIALFEWYVKTRRVI